MQTLSNSKAIISIIALFIAGMFIYNSFFASDRASMPVDPTASNVGNDLLEIRNQLQRVTLGREILSDEKFLELADFSADIPQLPTGRPNPFNVIGRD